MNLDHDFLDIESRADFRILSLAALFGEDFSIDWVQELAEVKTSEILATFEKGVERKILIKKPLGIFLFADRKQNCNCGIYSSPGSKSSCIKKLQKSFCKTFPTTPIRPKGLPFIFNNYPMTLRVAAGWLRREMDFYAITIIKKPWIVMIKFYGISKPNKAKMPMDFLLIQRSNILKFQPRHLPAGRFLMS